MNRHYEMNLDPTNEYVEVKYLVLKKDKPKYLSCFEKITKLLDKSKPIPAALFREWSSYLLNPGDVAGKEMNAHYLSVVKDTISFFSSKKGYNVNANNKASGIEFRFNECIYMTVKYYFNQVRKGRKPTELLKSNERAFALKTIYGILSVFSKPFDKPSNELLSHYKRLVISAYITQKLGFKIVPGKEYSLKDLQSQAKNILTAAQKKLNKTI